ncbi:hypothetical protein BLSTO_01503 [Blastocystis sp. subtype 1]
MSTAPETQQPEYSYLTEGGENCKTVRGYFQKKMRIEITDGRVFIGSLASIDCSADVILYNTTEYFHVSACSFLVSSADDPEKQFSRMAGRVVIPGKSIVKCEVSA